MDIQKVEYKKINEEVYIYKHKSGLKVYVVLKKGYFKKYAAFATKYGSIDNSFIIPGNEHVTDMPDGIAHFLEHKLFEQEDGSVMDKFSKLGSSPNAYTGFTHTAYVFTCTDRFDDNLRLLLNYVQKPYLTDENVEKEKGIIGQEIRMYQDSAQWRLYFNLLGALYENHPVKRDIAGSIDSISGITKDDLYLCYNTFYNPSNMVLLVVGDVEPESVFKMVDETVKGKQGSGEIIRKYPEERNAYNSEYVEQSLEVTMPYFLMGIKDNKRVEGYELIKREIALKIVLSVVMGRRSLLYTKLYEEGLINSSFGTDVTMEQNYGFVNWGGQSKDPQKAKAFIDDEISKRINIGLDQEVFERVKNAFSGRFIKSLNSVENIGHEFIASCLKDLDFFDYYRAYSEIDYDYTNNLFKEFFSQKACMSVIKPK